MWRAGRAEVCRRLDEVTAGAAVVIGHNVRRHDLPELAEQFPQAHCLGLPLIDTLELSAIAFPRNPYHRLVKGYKLLSDARNEPLLDARLALELLADEIPAFEALHASESAWCGLLHRLLRHERALDDLFGHIRAQAVGGGLKVRDSGGDGALFEHDGVQLMARPAGTRPAWYSGPMQPVRVKENGRGPVCGAGILGAYGGRALVGTGCTATVQAARTR